MGFAFYIELSANWSSKDLKATLSNYVVYRTGVSHGKLRFTQINMECSSKKMEEEDDTTLEAK